MKTLFHKLWDRHKIAEKEGNDLLYIDLHLIHEVTSPQAFEGLRQKGRKLRRTDKTFATMDHNTPTRREKRAIDAIDDALSREQLDALTRNAREFGVTLYDMDSDKNGIVHMVGPERGLSLPGKTIVCGDSHTATHGALGALAFGIGTSEVETVFATQCLWQRRPKEMGICVRGELPEGVSSKDIILKLLAEYSSSFATGYAMEFFGPTIEALSMDGRFTLCNMAIEAGAKFGLIRPDRTTLDYVKGREYAPKGSAWEAFEKEVETLYTDDIRAFDKVIELDVSRLKPQVSYGTNPGMTTDFDGVVPESDTEEEKKALAYMGIREGEALSELDFDVVFIGSCTNGRIEDFRIASEILMGRKVHSGLSCIIVPGSMEVLRQCREEGLEAIFLEAGCEMRMPGCSYCLAMNEDRIPKEVRCASTSNRNFEGRQGAGARIHLMSPYLAARVAVEGGIPVEIH